MRRILKAFLLGLIVSFCAAANAVPVMYDLTFDGTLSGPSGVGSIFFDRDTGLISEMTWSFGPSLSGGLDDALINWGATAFGDTVGRFQFEVMSGEDVHTGVACETAGCFVSWSPPFVTGSDFGQIQLWIRNSVTTYEFFPLNGQYFAGGLSVAEGLSVPEPGTLALFGLGLAGLGFARRREPN